MSASNIPTRNGKSSGAGNVFTERGRERADFKIVDGDCFADTSFTHWLPLPSAHNQAKPETDQ